jgi:hypothetical protein
MQGEISFIRMNLYFKEILEKLPEINNALIKQPQISANVKPNEEIIVKTEMSGIFEEENEDDSLKSSVVPSALSN